MGVSSQQALGQSIEHLLRQRAGDCVLPADLHLLMRRIAGPDPEPGDLEVVFLQINYRRLKVTVFPLTGDDGNDGAGLLFRDVTADMENDEFIDNLSHALLNPITSVIGYSELLGKVRLDQNQRGWLETIHTSGRRLAELVEDVVEDVVEATGLERDGAQYAEEIFSLDSAIDETLADTNLLTTFHQIEVRMNPHLPKVKTGRAALESILRNLLRNALNHGPRGSTVTLSARHEEQSGRLVISVKDQGQGIAESDADLVFTPFFQSRQLAESSDSATSLCLYIAKSLVKNLGEEIWWENDSHQGATFHFSVAAAP